MLHGREHDAACIHSCSEEVGVEVGDVVGVVVMMASALCSQHDAYRSTSFPSLDFHISVLLASLTGSSGI